MTNIFNLLAVVSAALTGYLYWIGLDRFYFWYYPWFDTALHLVGGITIGFWGAALASRRGLTPRLTFLCILILALLVGLLWELFEYKTGLSGGDSGYVFDTLTDLVGDLAGATLVWCAYWATYKPKNI